MKFTCLQENLTKALTKVYRAVPTKSELPILSNVLISAHDNRIKISATNLATTIVTHIGADVEEEGAITVPAKMLRDFISNLSPNNVELELRDDILHLKSSTTRSKFNGVPADDYPDLPQESKKMDSIQLNPSQFYELISSVAFSAAADDSKPIFTGVFLSYDGKKLVAAASDGYRLSEKSMKVENDKVKFTVVIPAKTLLDVTRVFADSEEPITFGIDANDNLAIFKQEDTLVATRIINGEYPDYKRIIPTKTNISAGFTVSELLEAVKLTEIFAKESDSSAIIIKVNPKGKLELSATSQEAGEHKSNVVANVTAENSVEIGFNYKYLLDFLNNVKATSVTLATSGDTNPCLFSLEEQDYFHIIMPIQIND